MAEHHQCEEPGCEAQTRRRLCSAHSQCMVEGCDKPAAWEGARCPACSRLHNNAMKRIRSADQRAAERARGLTTKGARPFNRERSAPAPIREAGAGAASFGELLEAIAQAALAPPEPIPPCISGGKDHHWMLETPNGPTSVGVCSLCGKERGGFKNTGPTTWAETRDGVIV